MRLLPMTMIATLLSLLAPLDARAQVEVTFPLGARYRVGKFLPARVVTKGDESIRVAAASVLPVEIAAGPGAADVIVPLLAIGTIQQEGWPSRPLAADERLVGATTPDAALAAELFPGRRIVDVTLDLSDPMPGPAMAWSALDAVFLDESAAARVTEGQLATLLSAGTTVAVRAGARPTGNGPWQPRGTWWVARVDAPPANGVVQPDRYTASSHEPPAWPPALRYRLLLALAAFSLAVSAVTLSHARQAWIACVLISIVATAAVALWWSRQPTAVRTVAVQNLAAVEDRWTFYTGVSDGEFHLLLDDPGDAVWPILFSKDHARDVGLYLACDSDGSPLAFAGGLRRGQRVAFLTRAFAPSLTPTPTPATSPATPPR